MFVTAAVILLRRWLWCAGLFPLVIVVARVVCLTSGLATVSAYCLLNPLDCSNDIFLFVCLTILVDDNFIAPLRTARMAVMTHTRTGEEEGANPRDMLLARQIDCRPTE